MNASVNRFHGGLLLLEYQTLDVQFFDFGIISIYPVDTLKISALYKPHINILVSVQLQLLLFLLYDN